MTSNTLWRSSKFLTIEMNLTDSRDSNPTRIGRSEFLFWGHFLLGNHRFFWMGTLICIWFFFFLFFFCSQNNQGPRQCQIKNLDCSRSDGVSSLQFLWEKKKDVNFEKWGSQLDEFKAVTSTRSEARANRRIVKIDRENVSINRPATAAFPWKEKARKSFVMAVHN